MGDILPEEGFGGDRELFFVSECHNKVKNRRMYNERKDINNLMDYILWH